VQAAIAALHARALSFEETDWPQIAGLIALIRQWRWRNDEDVIFLHTGGAPALFAYQSALGI
jgi:predicted RNA polymerase sigma factor